ncbi:MAG: hypothetical protein JXX28_01615 [Deltaproteobacteria bacterium]|nr:hypothetical protein [Deltaproteobacteria bacterium]
MRLLAALLLGLAPALAAATCPEYAQDPSLLVELEGSAGRGALDKEQVQCLEDNYQAAKLQTTKDKISRVLMVNAYAYQTSWWAELVQRHLNEVDRSDPNVAYLYSFYLFNQETPDYEAVIKWTEVALERKQDWTGDLHVHRVTKLLQARTYAAYKQWEIAENNRDLRNADEIRNRTKTFAREWLDFSRSSGGDTTQAAEFCVSVSSAHACGLDD